MNDNQDDFRDSDEELLQSFLAWLYYQLRLGKLNNNYEEAEDEQ